MKKKDLIPIIAQHNPLLANAVCRMVDYIQDRWAAPYPSKITISAIRVLDHDQLDRLQDVLNRIAADRKYHMPEQRYGMDR